MRLFATPPYRDLEELLDRPGEAGEEDLRHTLRDIRRANIFGLGTWVVLRHLSSIVRHLPPGRPLHLLDVATGSADIPEQICRWALAQGREVKIIATDISPQILSVARERIERAGFAGQISLLACDATAMPFAPDSFDVVICSLAMHHLDLPSARAALAEMKRLARVGLIVNDIYRSRGAWIMAWLLTRLTTTNRLTRHDGPASVYRAFTPREMARLSKEAGIAARIHKHPFWRVAAVWSRGER